MSAGGDARSTIVDALMAAGVPAVGHTPKALIPPIVAIEPGDPWYTVTRLGKGLQASLELRAVAIVNAIDSESSIAQLETLVEAAILALPAGVAAVDVGRPDTVDTGSQGEMLQAVITLIAHITDKE